MPLVVASIWGQGPGPGSSLALCKNNCCPNPLDPGILYGTQITGQDPYSFESRVPSQNVSEMIGVRSDLKKVASVAYVTSDVSNFLPRRRSVPAAGMLKRRDSDLVHQGSQKRTISQCGADTIGG